MKGFLLVKLEITLEECCSALTVWGDNLSEPFHSSLGLQPDLVGTGTEELRLGMLQGEGDQRRGRRVAVHVVQLCRRWAWSEASLLDDLT